MTSQPVPWLPSAGKGDHESALARVIETWLVDWIANPVSLKVQPRTKGELRPLRWHEASGVALGSDTDAEAMLGRSACNNVGDLTLAADRDVFAKVGKSLVDALSAFLSGLGDVNSPSAAKSRQGVPDGALFTVACTTNGWSLGMSLAPSALVRVRKAACSTARKAALGTRRAAFQPLSAQLGCHLGRAHLSAGDVAKLTVGDVIVVDGKPGFPLALAVEGIACAAGKVTIGRSAAGALITVSERVNLSPKAG